MLGRNVWFMALLVAAVVVPFHLSGDSQWSSMNNWWHSMWSNDAAQGDGSYRKAWPGAETTVPTATTSPLPAHYSRRPIQSLPTSPQRTTPTPQQPLSRVQAQAPNFQISPTPPLPSSVNARPQFHDWMPVNQSAGGVASSGVSIPGLPSNGATLAGDPKPALCGPNAPCMSHLINFDATPAWVMNNWQRVSTRLANFDLEGLRVPVMTGTSVEDLVGSMTYYFDRRQTLQRVMFDGYTGEPSPLVKVMTDKYQLKAEPWLGAGFYTQRDAAEKIASVMRVTHAPVVRASDARRRFAVEFELNRPESQFGLSERFATLIQQDRDSKVLASADESQPAEKTQEEIETEELIKRLEAEAEANEQAAEQQIADIESFQAEEAKRQAADLQAAQDQALRDLQEAQLRANMLAEAQRQQALQNEALKRAAQQSQPPQPAAQGPQFPQPAYANASPSVSSPSYSSPSPSGYAPPGQAQPPADPFLNATTPQPPTSPSVSSQAENNGAPIKPKPLNGSVDPQQRGFFGRLLDGASSGGPRLYPSQLPSNGQTYVPPPR